MRSFSAALLIGLLLAVPVAAQTSDQPEPEMTGSTPPLVEQQPPQPASWRDALQVLKVGFLAGENPIYRKAQAEPFRRALERALGIRVELVPARSYGALVEAAASAKVDYTILSASAYVALDERCSCAEPLVQPTSADGGTGFRPVIIGRADNPPLLAEMEGKSLAVGPASSLAGRLIPFAAFAAEGKTPETLFGRIVEAEDTEAAVLELAEGRVDMAVAWTTAATGIGREPGSGPVADLAAEGLVSPDDFTILWEAPLIPFGPHVVRRDLPEEAKRLLETTLLDMTSWQPEAYDAIERSLAGGFVKADAARYTALSALLTPRQ